MKYLNIIMIVFLLVNFCVYGQKTNNDIQKNNETNNVEKGNAPLAMTDEINVKNESGNAIITITDEGNSAGSILLPSVGAFLSGSKLYSNGVNLFWGNSQLNGSNGATTINDLVDAKFDGSSLFLGDSAGVYDNGTENFNTAVGLSALKQTLLEVKIQHLDIMPFSLIDLVGTLLSVLEL